MVDAGGPAAFINARPTSDRRFLVEQMAVLELIGAFLFIVSCVAFMFQGARTDCLGYLTIWVSPKLFNWDNEWFMYYDTGMSETGLTGMRCIADTETEEGPDHLETVYGWTREAIIYAARVCVHLEGPRHIREDRADL